MQLNKGQELAKQSLLKFLTTDEQFFVMSAAAGYGKTTVMKELEGDLEFFNKERRLYSLPAYTEVLYTATTNKASSLFGEATTVHKLFGLVPRTNYQTGESYLVTSKRTKHIANAIIVIDESSMINKQLYKLIKQYSAQSKVIFLLDPYQLPPVGYDESLVHGLGFPEATLTEPMRQDPDSHLFKTCDQIRTDVISQKYTPIQEGEGITFLNQKDFLATMVQSFKKGEDARVIAYTNEHVEALNKYVRKQLHNVDEFMQGDVVVAASTPRDSFVKKERAYTIESVSEPTDILGLTCRYVGIEEGSFPVPVDKKKYFSMLRRLKREAKENGDWTIFYEFAEGILDLRDGYACTSHASQGSTYDTVFLDFSNLTQATDVNLFLRMLYVAISRARLQVYIFGI